MAGYGRVMHTLSEVLTQFAKYWGLEWQAGDLVVRLADVPYKDAVAAQQVQVQVSVTPNVGCSLPPQSL